MARVKVCPVCGNRNGPTATFCSRPLEGGLCGAPLARVRPMEDGASEPATAEIGATKAAPPVGLPPPATLAAPPSPTAREAAPFHPRLVFPWGEVEVGAGLAVGRDSIFSPIAAQLAAFPFVSNRHAELFVSGGALRVRHIGSTNPTYVNGRALQTGETTQLADGDTLGFSKGPRVQVRLR